MTALPLDDEPTCLYRPYNARGRLLYVGIAVDVESRMKQHEVRSPWYGDVAAMHVELYPDRRSAAAAESEAIAAEWPLWNVHQSPWGGVARDRMRQLDGYWRQDRWGRWHQLPPKPLAAWKPHSWTEADERRFQKRLARDRRVRRLTREAVRAASLRRLEAVWETPAEAA